MKIQPLLTETAGSISFSFIIATAVQFCSGLHYGLICALDSDGNEIQNEGKILMLLQTSFQPEILSGTNVLEIGLRCEM